MRPRAVARTSALSDDRDGEATADRGNATTGLEFKQQLSVLKDSAPDMDRHTKEFQPILSLASQARAATEERLPIGQDGARSPGLGARRGCRRSLLA